MKVKLLISLVYCKSVIQAVAKPGLFNGRGVGGAARGLQGSAGRFCNFSIKIMHFYAYFGQNKFINYKRLKLV